MTLQAAFLEQARACEKLASPFMGKLLRILAEIWPKHGPLHQAVQRFEGDIGPSGHSAPLRVAAGLHALTLSRKCPELSKCYPPNICEEEDLKTSISYALDKHISHLLHWLGSPPQTNEVRRSAVLIAASQVALSHFQRPIVLSELGASAGLNLMWDRYACTLKGQRFGATDPALMLTPDWDGPLPPCQRMRIAARAGVDLAPLDPGKSQDRLRLLSYLWPDQPQRLSLTQAALDVLDTKVTKGDAIDWLEQRLQQNFKGHLHVIQNTIAWQYFPPQAQARGEKLIQEAGERANAQTPLAWISMEADDQPHGAKITLRLWPGNVTLTLGRADFHGRWIRWVYS